MSFGVFIFHLVTTPHNMFEHRREEGGRLEATPRTKERKKKQGFLSPKAHKKAWLFGDSFEEKERGGLQEPCFPAREGER